MRRIALAIAAAALLAACGDDEPSASTDAATSVPTTFQTVPAPTTIPPSTLAPLPTIAPAASIAPTIAPSGTGGATATTVVGATATTVTGASSGTGAGSTATTLSAPGECVPGKYTIQTTDTSRIKVADKFDVTVQALDAANANTAGYSSFYAGLEIIIPC
jgi:hypothetical protein